MPVIESSSAAVIASFDGATGFSATGALALYLSARFDGDTAFSANGAQAQAGTAQFAVGGSFTANGHIIGEPDLFGVGLFAGVTTFVANGSLKINGLAIFSGSTAFEADGAQAQAEDFELNLIIDILPPASSGNYIEQWLPRLKVDGTEIPVTGGQYSENDRDAGSDIQVELARLSDRTLLTANAVIEFGLGRKVAGAWDEATFQNLLSDGVVRNTDRELGWQNNQPTDSVSAGSASNVSDRFSKTPETDVVIYDPARQTVNQSDFEILKDTAGNTYPTELEPIASLSLYKLFDEVLVTRCGFSGYKTNLPDFPISRVDCQIGQPYLDSIGGYFGMFDPAIFPVGDEIWITDTSIAQPSGFPAPRTVAISSYRTLRVSEAFLDIDGLILQYVEDKRNYDYTTTRTETETEESGTFGNPDYTSTFIQRFYREYRRLSNPGLVLREELYFEERITSGSGGVGVIGETRENYDFDSNGKFTARTKTAYALVPDVDNPGTDTLRLVFEESEDLSYAAHPFQARSQYVQRREVRTSGLVAVDADNQQLGEDFRLDYQTAYRRGNLVEGMTTQFVPVKTYTETTRPLRSGQVKVKIYEADLLANVVVTDTTEERSGDIAINGIAPRQNRVLVLEDDASTPTGKRLQTLHAGELPPVQALALARRRLSASKTKNRTLQADVIGYDAGLRKGLPVALTGRGGEAIGNFLIIGRSVNFGREGAFMNLTCKEI